MRTFALTACLLSLGAVSRAGDRTQGHPHFDDGGTLRWYTRMEDAAAAAKKEGKLVFIEYGREA